jgi:hypothetical protein
MALYDVSPVGVQFPDSEVTYKLAAGTVLTDVGKPVTLTATYTVGVAGAAAPIFGRLMSFEDRSDQGLGLIGTVSQRFITDFPAAGGHGLAVNDMVCGSAVSGNVQKVAAGVYNNCIVVGVVGNVISVSKV